MQHDFNYEKVVEHIEKLPLLILVMDHTRPGTDFFQSLTDGHPEILQVTGCTIYKFKEFWDAVAKDDIDELINYFVFNENHYRIFDSRFFPLERWHRLGPNKDEYFQVDVDAFCFHMKELLNRMGVTKKSFFLAVHAAYWLAAGRQVESTKVILFHIHFLDRWSYFCNDLPEPKVVVSTRDFRDGLVSWIENRPSDCTFYYSYKGYMAPFKSYPKIFRDLSRFKSVRFIPLNKLHHEPESVMKTFCFENNISYIPEILLVSNYHGKLWWGDAWSKKWPQGFNSKFGLDEKWRSKLNFFDRVVIEALFEEQMLCFGYKFSVNGTFRVFAKLFLPLLILLPMKYEIKIYAYQLSKKRSHFKIALEFFHGYFIRISCLYRYLLNKLFKKNIRIC